MEDAYVAPRTLSDDVGARTAHAIYDSRSGNVVCAGNNIPELPDIARIEKKLAKIQSSISDLLHRQVTSSSSTALQPLSSNAIAPSQSLAPSASALPAPLDPAPPPGLLDDAQSDAAFLSDPSVDETAKKKLISHRKAFRRLHRKLKNIMTDFSHKMSRWFTSAGDFSIIPKFPQKEMMAKLPSYTAHCLSLISHSVFRQMCFYKSEENMADVYIEASEEYTSKTCGDCGLGNEHLGSDKVFVCPHDMCQWIAGRDANGARSILLRLLTISSNDSRM